MLQIYGVPLSQPCRAVIWACLYKRLPFELVLTNPGSRSVDRAGNPGSRHPDFLAMNPTGSAMHWPYFARSCRSHVAVILFLCQ